MKPYQKKPGEAKYKLLSYENQQEDGRFPIKKTRHKKDVIKAANRSRKKALRNKVKKEIKAELTDWCGSSAPWGW
jgi:hypothetical protein